MQAADAGSNRASADGSAATYQDSIKAQYQSEEGAGLTAQVDYTTEAVDTQDQLNKLLQQEQVRHDNLCKLLLNCVLAW